MFMITTVGMISIKISKGKIYWPKTILRSPVLWRYTWPIIISNGTFFKPILEFHSTFDCCHNQSSPLQLVCHDSSPLAFFFSFFEKIYLCFDNETRIGSYYYYFKRFDMLELLGNTSFYFSREREACYIGSLPWCREILNAEIFLGNADTVTKNLMHEGGSFNTTGHWYTWHC